MSTGLPTLASGGRNARSRARVSAENGDDGQAGRFARVDGENAGSAGVGDDRDAPAGGQRLRVEARRDVEHLVDRVGADDAGLMEQRVDGDVARGQRGRVAAGRARPGARPAGLDRDDRLLPRDAPREAREAPRVAERLEVEQDDRRVRRRLPSTRSRSLLDTSALLPTLTNADRPTLPLGWRAPESPGRARRSATRTRLRPAGGTIGENEALSWTPGAVLSSAHAVGPDHPHARGRGPCRRAAAAARGPRRRFRRSRR